MKYLVSFAALLLLSFAARAGDDALDEANRARAARGLPAFVRDEGLSQAAMRAADFRAARLIEAHSGNDFAFLPQGCSADAAGCAAWPPGLGFGACALYERYTYAGAASTQGRDGRLYHHLFVRNGGGGQATAPTSVSVGVTANYAAPSSGGCGQTSVRVSIREGRRFHLFRGRCR